MRKIQLVLAWFCPVILSCHYYSPKLTHFTLAGALFGMLCATYIGLYCGVWDANMMRAVDMPGDAAFRAEFIREATAAGDNLLLRVFNFYYIPRAAIVIVVYLISVTLSRRTHGLLKKQEDNREKEQISDRAKPWGKIWVEDEPGLWYTQMYIIVPAF